MGVRVDGVGKYERLDDDRLEGFVEIKLGQ